MLFNSVSFLVFFVFVLVVFWRLQGRNRKFFLLASSLFFYGWWDWRFLFHFVGITLVSYVFVRLLLGRRSRALLTCAVGLNLANLIFFKYTNSVLLIVADQFGLSGALVVKERLSIVLPLAISFYTFQIVAFLVDVYRGQVRDASVWDFLVFILFFPQLIAGPIMRHSDFMDQLDRPTVDENSAPEGMFLLGLGLAKKVIIADGIAAIIDPVWVSPREYSASANVLAALGFTVQVFCDFSGYTDMARGMARLLGYRIPENFYAPYLAGSFADLWKRWHVTLSTWLRDYLYIPLGGSRVSAWRLHANILIVMCLGGLWHGNNYTFFIWGFLHGLALVLEKLAGAEQPSEHRFVHAGRVVLVYTWFVVGAVFFRAPDLTRAFDVFQSVAREGKDLTQAQALLELLAAGWLLVVLQYHMQAVTRFVVARHRWLLPLISLVVYFMIARIERGTGEFIYFQF